MAKTIIFQAFIILPPIHRVGGIDNMPNFGTHIPACLNGFRPQQPCYDDGSRCTQTWNNSILRCGSLCRWSIPPANACLLWQSGRTPHEGRRLPAATSTPDGIQHSRWKIPQLHDWDPAHPDIHSNGTKRTAMIFHGSDCCYDISNNQLPHVRPESEIPFGYGQSFHATILHLPGDIERILC
jgi:hypothetical protein